MQPKQATQRSRRIIRTVPEPRRGIRRQRQQQQQEEEQHSAFLPRLNADHCQFLAFGGIFAHGPCIRTYIGMMTADDGLNSYLFHTFFEVGVGAQSVGERQAHVVRSHRQSIVPFHVTDPAAATATLRMSRNLALGSADMNEKKLLAWRRQDLCGSDHY